MTATTIVAIEGALATSVAITIDVLAMANRECHARGRRSAFDVRLAGSGAAHFRPFLAFPESGHTTEELLVVPAQGLSKAPSYAGRLSQIDAEDARSEIRRAAEAGAHVAGSCTGTLMMATAGPCCTGRWGFTTWAWWLPSSWARGPACMFPA